MATALNITEYDPAKALRYQQERTKALLQAYRQSKRELDAILRNAAATPFQKFRAGEHIAQIKAQIRVLNARAVSISRDLAKSGYRQGVDASKPRLLKAGFPPSGQNMGNIIHTASVEALADKFAADLLTANASLERAALTAIRATQQAVISESAVTKAVMRSEIQGQTYRATADALRNAFTKANDGAKIIINGRKYDPESYSELVARTMTRAAQTQGTINNSLQFGITLFQVSTHVGACDKCLALQGKVFSLGPNPDGFPELQDAPPFHPNCAHVLMPYVETNRGRISAMAQLSTGREIKSQADYDARLRELMEAAA